jgi:hypothetical protein
MTAQRVSRQNKTRPLPLFPAVCARAFPPPAQALAADVRLACDLWRDAFDTCDMSHDDAFRGGDACLADAVEDRLQVCWVTCWVQRVSVFVAVAAVVGEASCCCSGKGRSETAVKSGNPCL